MEFIERGRSSLVRGLLRETVSYKKKMEDCLDEVLRVIQECMQFSDSHIYYIDKAVICLKVIE